MSTTDPGRPGRRAGRPVFVDPTGRRGRWVQRTAVALRAVMFVVVALFVLSLVSVPMPPHVLGVSPAVHAIRPTLPALPLRARERDRFMAAPARPPPVSELAAAAHARRARH